MVAREPVVLPLSARDHRVHPNRVIHATSLADDLLLVAIRPNGRVPLVEPKLRRDRDPPVGPGSITYPQRPTPFIPSVTRAQRDEVIRSVIRRSREGDPKVIREAAANHLRPPALGHNIMLRAPVIASVRAFHLGTVVQVEPRVTTEASVAEISALEEPLHFLIARWHMLRKESASKED